MTTSETLFAKETLADMARNGLAEEIVIRKDEDGQYSVHIRAGQVHGMLRTKRGEPKYCKTMEPLASLLYRMGIKVFGYQELAPVTEQPPQGNLFDSKGRLRGARTPSVPMRKSA